MVLLGAWAGLRFGELAALRRRDLDLDRAVVHVRRAVVVVGHRQEEGTPKSAAGKRGVAFHQSLVEPLRQHLEEHAQPGPDGLLFPGANGGWLRPSSFWGIFDVARKAAGWEGDFHDLRHTGISAYSKLPGVTVKELLRWSGHSTLGVSLRYPHVDEEDARDLVQGMQVGDERVVPMRQRRAK